jgi:ribosomal protein L10
MYNAISTMDEKEFLGWVVIALSIIILWFAFKATESEEDKKVREQPYVVTVQQTAAKIDKGIKENKKKRKRDGKDKGRVDTTPEFMETYGAMANTEGAETVAKLAGTFGPTLVAKFGGAMGFLSGK